MDVEVTKEDVPKKYTVTTSSKNPFDLNIVSLSESE